MHQHARGVVLEYSGIVKTERFDEQFFYDGNDLGYTYDRDQTAFALWAPTASRVKLEVCKNNRLYTYEMKRTDKGVYRYTILENLENATYVYLVRVNGVWRESIDPYGTASIENSPAENDQCLRCHYLRNERARFHDAEGNRCHDAWKISRVCRGK